MLCTFGLLLLLIPALYMVLSKTVRKKSLSLDSIHIWHSSKPLGASRNYDFETWTCGTYAGTKISAEFCLKCFPKITHFE